MSKEKKPIDPFTEFCFKLARLGDSVANPVLFLITASTSMSVILTSHVNKDVGGLLFGISTLVYSNISFERLNYHKS